MVPHGTLNLSLPMQFSTHTCVLLLLSCIFSVLCLVPSGTGRFNMLNMASYRFFASGAEQFGYSAWRGGAFRAPFACACLTHCTAALRRWQPSSRTCGLSFVPGIRVCVSCCFFFRRFVAWAEGEAHSALCLPAPAPATSFTVAPPRARFWLETPPHAPHHTTHTHTHTLPTHTTHTPTLTSSTTRPPCLPHTHLHTHTLPHTPTHTHYTHTTHTHPAFHTTACPPLHTHHTHFPP